MVQVLEPDTGYEFFQVDRTTEMQIVDFFFKQRNRIVTQIKKLKGKSNKARELLLAKKEYDAICLFELQLGLKHETQANNLGLRLRKNHAFVLQKIFASNKSDAKKLKKELMRIVERETRNRLFRSTPKQLKGFFEQLFEEPA